MKRKDTTVVGLILVTILICFVTWFQYTIQDTTTKIEEEESIPVIFPQPFELYQPKKNSEKFLSYLPHSGFHNQRIELENALLLAAYLNRTLLVPPVYLANPAMPWLRYEKLHERLLFQTKNGLAHCTSLDSKGLPLPSECLNNFRWTNVPWTFFYNMTELPVPVIFRPGLDYEWLYDSFNLNQQDIYFFKDMSPYEYQIHDIHPNDLPMDRFKYKINLDKLEQIDHRVLHFGSVFGSYRVLAETDEHADLLKKIRTAMIFRNPVLFGAAKRIVDQLGGPNQFVGMHVRVGDGIFKLRASILIDDIFHQLVDQFTDLTVEQVIQYEEGIEQHDLDRTESVGYELKLREAHANKKIDYSKPITVNHTNQIPFDFKNKPNIANRLTCQEGDEVTSRFKNTVVYIATDAPDPRNHPLLRKLFKVFPCTFILSDFMEELNEIKRLQVVEERVKLESYLIPMVDAMISAHGHTFLGTPHSTFTSYVERQLHPVYTGKEVQVMGLLDYLESMKA